VERTEASGKAPGDARRAFLAALIDDAGLFPPARLPMDEAVASHEASRGGPNGWMMGRFLCPASRLEELAGLLPPAPGEPWRVGVILDGAEGSWPEASARDLEAARAFEEQATPRARVELLEAPLPLSLVEGKDPAGAAEEVERFVERVGSSGLRGPVAPYLEVPRGPGWAYEIPTVVEGIARARAAWTDGSSGTCLAPGAKLRCGGLVAEAFPSPEQVAAFVGACARLGVPFKATAGLHHPFRHVDEETGFLQHGFVNLVGAAILAPSQELPDGELAELVADEDPSGFSLSEEGFCWRSCRADKDEVARARRELFVAYGSCSFAEPVEDLAALGVLPAVAA
jgi:hypothetical protein